jgi:hypothetical protein
VASVGPAGCVVEVVNSSRGLDTGPLLRLSRGAWPSIPTARMRRRALRPATFGRSHRRAGRTARDETIAALPESGRGLAIMEACVDGVTLSSGPENGTVVSLQKRLAWRKDALLARLPNEHLRNAG